MRIRNAAIAGATAFAVAFGGVSIASAQEEASQPAATAEDKSSQEKSSNVENKLNSSNGENEENKSSNGSFSSRANDIKELETDKDATGANIFGSTKTDFAGEPLWAKLFYGLTVVASLASIIGLIVGPIDNFIKYGR
ncbi:MAG: hypothetical protein SOW59_02020 [Corynebacterium sp.]|nr:hypothetical protein [Corynebacterium sp.]